ncbi:hypothetical protein HK104_001477 [Borealophlyctis nickersoniae]|nr:hypothetical protein HK104_001477 [Borealophlyctis nickersoniae]
MYRLKCDFKPTLGDEMEGRAGDIVIVKDTFTDGWAEGKNLSRGNQGMFALDWAVEIIDS